ncbi:MAG TPA: hypothetical protein DEG43_02225 [Acidimicrobiaceae bacterium]|nr:hypothetical protein [Acidimicrobiaceae bacterium]
MTELPADTEVAAAALGSDPTTVSAIATSRSRHWGRRIAIVVAALLALVFTIAAVEWSRVDRLAGALPGSGTTSTVWMLIGSDSREFAPEEGDKKFGSTEEVPGERGDVVLLLRIDPEGTVQTLGIPRDLLVIRPGRGEGRLGLFFSDGIAAMSEGLCHSLGIGIDHVAVVHFDGLAGLVDRVGGVQVQSESILRDLSAGLVMKAGQSELQGDQALAYIRARHLESFKNGEWTIEPELSEQRSERAFTVLRGIGSRLEFSPTSPIASVGTAHAIIAAISLSDEVGPLDAIELGRALRSIEGDRSTLPSERPKLGTAAQDVPMLVPTADSLKAAHEFVGGPSTTCTQPLDN